MINYCLYESQVDELGVTDPIQAHELIEDDLYTMKRNSFY